MKAVLFIAALAACAGSAPPEPLRTPRPKPRPAPAAHVDIPAAPGAERWLVLEQHEITSSTARYIAVRLADDPHARPTVTELGEAVVVSNPLYSPGARFLAVAAQDGNRWVALAPSERGGLRAVVRSLDDATSLATIELGDIVPAALHLVRDALWVGTSSRVGWIDLAAARPRFQLLVDRGTQTRKHYDLFARSGDRLLAIDDIVYPMYADWFALDVRGAPREHLGDWQLPATVYGHYTAAVLSPDVDGFALFATTTSSSGWSGPGHELFRRPIERDALIGGADMAPQVSETRGAGRAAVPSVVAGDTFTSWDGLAVSIDRRHLLVAAGDRGLFVFPSALPAHGRPSVVDLGGTVRDLAVRGSNLLALVTTSGASELVVLTPTFDVAARHPLPGVLDRFVD